MLANIVSQRVVGIAHSKHRNAIGLVGIEVIPEERLARVKLARQWPRSELNQVPEQIADLYFKYKWHRTHVDQLVGQYMIKYLKQRGMPLRVISTKKDMKNPADIEKIKVMDRVEMTHFMIMLKQNRQIEFPPSPPETVRELESQMALFTEHKTEAGTVDYYSPGDEKDNLTKALMIACFSARKMLKGASGPALMGAIEGPNVRMDAEAEIEAQMQALHPNTL